MAGPTRSNRLRLQVLATSWRLHPPRAYRPCFMPDPPLGSPSRALFLPRSRAPFPAPLPSWRWHCCPPTGFCSARESATWLGGLDRNQARSSPGPFPLQGSNSLGDGPVFTGPPLMRFARPDANVRKSPASGCPSPKAWPISRETANPPGVSGLMTCHIRSSRTRFGSRLLRSPGCVAAPCLLPL